MVRKMRDIMSPAPICMAPGESVSAAATAMEQHGIGTVLVLTGGRLSGLVTDRDITVRVLAESRDPLTAGLAISAAASRQCSARTTTWNKPPAWSASVRSAASLVCRTKSRFGVVSIGDSRWTRTRDQPCPASDRPRRTPDQGSSGCQESQNRSSGKAARPAWVAVRRGRRYPARRPPGFPLPAPRAGHAAERADPGRRCGRGRPGAVCRSYRTPKAISQAGWQDRVDALGRGHYWRYASAPRPCW